MTVQGLVGASLPSAKVNAGQVNAAGENGAVGVKEPEVFDFQRPTTLGRDQMRALTSAFDNFARQWSTQLTAMTHVLAKVEVESINVERYGEYADALGVFTAIVLLKIDGMGSRGVLQFDPEVAISWVGRMLGGNGSIPAPNRVFTAIEEAVVGRLIEYVIEDLTYSLGEELSGDIALDEVQYNPQMAQAMRAGDFVVVVRFSIQVGSSPATSTLAFPIEALAPREDRGDTAVGDRDRLIAQLDAAPVTIALELEPAIVGPTDILRLAQGDLIRLPHAQHRPLNVTVDGLVVARAAAGTSGRRLACVIVNLEETL
jgi:flagellar motor switch protein FliM